MVYMMWMMTDMKLPLPENIRLALEHHKKKYGQPPNIVEHSYKLKDLMPVDGVTYHPINIPENILLVVIEK